MGTSTNFKGKIDINPRLSREDLEWIEELSGNYGDKSANQPHSYMQWAVVSDGKKDALKWDGDEKFYYGFEWMQYIVEHLKDRYQFEGELQASVEGGEFYVITVHDNVVKKIDYKQLRADADEMGKILAVFFFAHPTIATLWCDSNKISKEDMEDKLKQLEWLH